MGAGVVLIAVLVLSLGRRTLRTESGPISHSADEAELIAVGDLD
jgi:hypothetical protein